MGIEDMARYQRRALIAILIVVGLALTSSVFMLLHPDSNSTPSGGQPTQQAVIEEKANVDLYLDAMLRHYMIVKACYSSSSNLYFAEVPKHNASLEEYYSSGWHILDSYKFRLLDNGTAILYDTTMDVNNVYPSVEGLQCKEQGRNPSWHTK